MLVCVENKINLQKEIFFFWTFQAMSHIDKGSSQWKYSWVICIVLYDVQLLKKSI